MKAIIRPHGRRRAPRAEKASTPNRYEYKEYERLQALPLDEKIEWSVVCVERAIAQLKTPSLAFSAGKDSTVLLHLVRQVRPQIITIWGNTTIEFPECITFAKQLRDEWKLNFYEAKPERSLYDHDTSL